MTKESGDEALFEQLNAEREESKKRLYDLKDKGNRLKKERDVKNASVNEAKEKRNKATSRIVEIKRELSGFNDLMRDLPNAPYGELKREYDELNWAYQTEVFSKKKEGEIVKRLDFLERQADAAKKFRDNREKYNGLIHELKDLKQERKTQHELVLKSATDSENVHKDLIKVYDEMDALKSKLDENDKRIKEEFPEEAPAAPAHKAPQSRKDLKEQAEKIMEEFQKGKKKLTLDDLALLQQHGL